MPQLAFEGRMVALPRKRRVEGWSWGDAAPAFEDSSGPLLISQANAQKLPVWPTIPTRMDAGTWPGLVTPGARGVDVSDGIFGGGFAWVSSKRPYGLRGRPLYRPRTAILTGGNIGGTPESDGPGWAFDDHWSEIDDGGWSGLAVNSGTSTNQTAIVEGLPLVGLHTSGGVTSLLFEWGDFAWADCRVVHCGNTPRSAYPGFTFSSEHFGTGTIVKRDPPAGSVEYAYREELGRPITNDPFTDNIAHYAWLDTGVKDSIRAAFDRAASENPRFRGVVIAALHAGGTTDEDLDELQWEDMVSMSTRASVLAGGVLEAAEVDFYPTASLKDRMRSAAAAWLAANL